MAQKAKFKLLSKWNSGLSCIMYHDIELTDADDDVSRYNVKDYYSVGMERIEVTTIEAIRGECDVENKDVSCDSYLGKKILTFINNE